MDMNGRKVEAFFATSRTDTALALYSESSLPAES